MAIPNPTMKFTYEDYLNTPDDKRYELLDGELVMPPAPRRISSKCLYPTGGKNCSYSHLSIAWAGSITRPLTWCYRT